MNLQPIEQAKDPDIWHSLAALRRAAARARDIAAATHTELVIARNGVLEYVAPPATDRIQEPPSPYTPKS